MNDGDEMQPGEIARSLKRLEQAIGRVDTRIENLDVVKRGEYLAHRQGDEIRLTAIEADVKDLQDDARANRRLVLGSFALPLVVLVLGGLLLAALA